MNRQQRRRQQKKAGRQGRTAAAPGVRLAPDLHPAYFRSLAQLVRQREAGQDIERQLAQVAEQYGLTPAQVRHSLPPPFTDLPGALSA